MEANFFPIGFDKEKLIQQMKFNNLDGVLLTSPESISYVTGYPCLPSSGNPILFAIRNHYPFYVFISDVGETFLVAWEYSLLDIKLGVDHLIKHVNADQAMDCLSNLLQKELGIGKNLGIESTCPYQISSFIQNWVSPGKLSIVDEIFDKIRLIKKPAELFHLKKSCEIVEKTLSGLFPLVKPGLHRSDLITAAKEGMIHNGASGIGHCTISFGASNPEVEINEVLEKDRLVIIDLGAMYYGYASDIRRMLYTGIIPEKMGQLHSTMCEIVATIGNALVPGAVVKDLCTLAETLYVRNSLEPNFTHLGHTIGLQTEEVWCDRKNVMKLEPGMVVNVELYSMMSSGENIGDEETYIVASGEPERMNRLPKEIRKVLS
jgi:Xaa-Pro aminopeptidase